MQKVRIPVGHLNGYLRAIIPTLALLSGLTWSSFFGSSALARQIDPHAPPANSQVTGVSTGPPRPTIRDAQSRPITAGGFVDGAPVVFQDTTKGSGLEKFQHRSGGPEKSTILESVGSGV